MEQPDGRPYVSVLIHYRDHDPDDLQALVDCLEAQDYPHLELFLTTDPAAQAIADTVASLLVSIHIHKFEERVSAAVAANRAIRESFSELLVFLSPGDRLKPTAIQDLVSASLANSQAGWVCTSAASDASLGSPLRGALVPKSTFRDNGLFDPNPFLENKYQQAWRSLVERSGLIAHDLGRETLQVRGASPDRRPVVGKAELRNLKEAVRAGRKQAESV
jgi:hypothetical protein